MIFSSFASENTAETKAGEQPFTTITFGKIDGDNVYARLADEPFVAAIRRGLIDQISTDAVQWQELSIFKFKPEQIHRLSVAAKNESMLARDAKDEWTWTKGGETINQANLQSLLKTLSSLHAVRWVGPTLPQHGFEKPQLAITFATSLDDKSSHKLLVGSKDGHGTWFARAEEREGTFVISDSDFDTLRLSLATETGSPPAPAASVPASPSPAAAPKSSP